MAKKNVLVNLDLNQNQILNVLLQKLTTTPDNVKEAQLWYDTGRKLVFYHNGTEAIPVGYLAPATTTTLGGVKIGANVNVTADGIISINDATNAQTGVIRIATDTEASLGTAQNIAINPKQLATEITKALSSALIYKGVWQINGASTTAYPAAEMLPAKKGDMYIVNGTGPSTVDGVEWNPGDYLVFNQDVTSGTITSAMVDKIDSTEASDIVRLNATQVLTNKTIDADNNTISNLEVDNFKAGVVQTTVRDSGTATDTTLVTEKAVASAIEGTVFTVSNPTLTATENIVTWSITNSIGRATVIASIRETGSGNEVLCDITYTADTITVKMNKSSDVPAGTYTAVIIG